MDKETQVRLEKGREHYENREYDRAEPFLRKVAEVESGYADVNNMLGVIYHSKGQFAKAQEFFEKALETNPRYTEAALNLSVVYNERGLYAKAKKVHAHIRTFRPTTDRDIEPYARGKLANMHAELGRAYSDLGFIDESVTQYREALGLCPEFIDLRTRLGQVLKDAGDLKGAEKELRAAKELKPSYLPARISLGVAYFTQEKHDDARREWEDVLEADPDNVTARMYTRMLDQIDAAPATDGGTSEAPSPKEDLGFSFDGERSSVAPADPTEED